MILVQVCILAVLLMIFIQDIKSKSVYWILFPLLALLLIVLRILLHRQSTLIRDGFLNIAFLILQLTLVSVYFSIKRKKWVNISHELLGWGDVLFLLCSCVYPSFLNFVLFYLASLIGSLAGWMAYGQFTAAGEKQIPLAGLQAMVFVLFLTISWWVIPLNLSSDDWLLNLYVIK